MKGRKGLLNQKGMPLGLRNKEVTMSRTVRKGALFCIVLQGSAKFPEGKKSHNVLSMAFTRESKSSG